MFQGLRSLIYPSANLDADKAFWTKTLGFGPYFDEPFYVGFNVGGYELGLDPNGSAEGVDGPTTYWGVASINAAAADLKGKGVALVQDVTDVGGDIRMAIFKDAAGFRFGIIENPHFKLKG